MDPSEVCVLVVEDDEFTRMATIDILRSCRYEVFAVENGKEALDALMQEPTKYDLVLCDVMLPVMNGIQLLAAMMERNGFNSTHSLALHHIPVVMTSSNEEMDVVTNCLSKGAKDYLIKPIQVKVGKSFLTFGPTEMGLHTDIWVRTIISLSPDSYVEPVLTPSVLPHFQFLTKNPNRIVTLK